MRGGNFSWGTAQPSPMKKSKPNRNRMSGEGMDMSTICAEECFALDMEWYGVDRQGHIAVFCSAGEGNLPKFVC